MESAACGLLAARNIYARLEGKELPAPPIDTMCGALIQYLTTENKHFQPMGANMGILPRTDGDQHHPRQAGALHGAFAGRAGRHAGVGKGVRSMKILVDAMGGDNAPLCVLQGVSQAAAEFGDGMELVLLGEEKAIRDCAKENKIDLAPFEILNCTETIDMHDDPVKAVRHKRIPAL